jgi:hypothetical protein
MECIHLHLGLNVLIKTRLNTNTQKSESVNRTLTKQTQSLELGGEHFLVGFTVACTCETVVKSCASQNCLSLLRFVRLFSCCVIYISVSYIFQLSCHKTAVDVSTSSFTSGLYRGWNTTVSHVHATVNPTRKCSPPSGRIRARFSLDVTKRCNAEIKQAHTQFTGDMMKIIRKLSYTSDCMVQFWQMSGISQVFNTYCAVCLLTSLKSDVCGVILSNFTCTSFKWATLIPNCICTV